MGVSKRIKRKSYTDFTMEEVFELFRTEKTAYGVSEKTIENYNETSTSLLVCAPVKNLEE